MTYLRSHRKDTTEHELCTDGLCSCGWEWPCTQPSECSRPLCNLPAAHDPPHQRLGHELDDLGMRVLIVVQEWGT